MKVDKLPKRELQMLWGGGMLYQDPYKKEKEFA
jgi:hypothetical protein